MHIQPVHVFTYGSLMFAPVWQRVVNGHYQSLPAKLTGYERLAVKGEDYPVALPAPDQQIEGVLYQGVNDADLQLLDEFEGEYYERILVTVIGEHGQAYPAHVYILRPTFLHIAENKAWDVAQFATGGGLEAFLQRYQGFEQIQH